MNADKERLVEVIEIVHRNHKSEDGTIMEAIASAILKRHPYLEWPCLERYPAELTEELEAYEIRPKHHYGKDDCFIECINCGQPKPEVKE